MSCSLARRIVFAALAGSLLVPLGPGSGRLAAEELSVDTPPSSRFT